MATKILSCVCSNTQQDQLHGAGKRVFNQTAKKDPVQYRCTVCGVVKGAGGGPVETKKKAK